MLSSDHPKLHESLYKTEQKQKQNIHQMKPSKVFQINQTTETKAIYPGFNSLNMIRVHCETSMLIALLFQNKYWCSLMSPFYLY